jgi:hypothetical protein
MSGEIMSTASSFQIAPFHERFLIPLIPETASKNMRFVICTTSAGIYFGGTAKPDGHNRSLLHLCLSQTLTARLCLDISPSLVLCVKNPFTALVIPGLTRNAILSNGFPLSRE